MRDVDLINDDGVVLLSLLSYVFSALPFCVAAINVPSTCLLKLRFSALCCCKQRLFLRLIVSLGMVSVVSMSTDDDSVIAVLWVTKFTTWYGGSPTIAVSPEPIVRIDRDKVDLYLTTIWDGCDATIELSLTTILDKFNATIFFFVISIRFRYVSY